MSFREAAGSLEDYFLEYYGDVEQLSRTPEVIALEKELNAGLKPWAHNHKERYKHMGALPVFPRLFTDQRIDKPGREVTRLSRWLPESIYTKLHKRAYAKAVGSVALADAIIERFKVVPAFADEPGVSLVDYTVSCLKNNESLAIASGHLDSLSDITDFTDGLNLAVAEEHGLEYAGRFKVVVNKLMALESIFGVPVPWLISVGLASRWGLPEKGAQKWGISQEAQNMVNGLLAQTLLKEQREKGQVVGIVPAGSAAVLDYNQTTGELEKLHLPHSSAIASLFPRYKAIIPANRWGEKISIGSLVTVGRPKDMHIKSYSHELTDQINYTLALQASELTGVSVEFEKLKAASGAAIVAVAAVTETRPLEA